MIKLWLALSAFAAASADVALRWPGTSATALAMLLFGPLIFGMVWLTVRGISPEDASAEASRESSSRRSN
jgi:hypothetical protein